MKVTVILISISIFFQLSSLVQAKELDYTFSGGGIEEKIEGRPSDVINIQKVFFTGKPVDERKLEKFEAKVNKLYRKLERRKSKYKESDNFYEYFFYAVHNKLLKEFKKEADLAALVEEGTYNCLTATLLYAHILSALEVDYEVLEYPYHVNLLVQNGEERFLFEATNPLAGFIHEPVEIEKNIAYHTAGGGKEVVLSSTYKSCNRISFKELAGLLYFNKAVYFFNGGNYEAAKLAVAQAQLLYPSGRLDDLKNYIASLQ